MSTPPSPVPHDPLLYKAVLEVLRDLCPARTELHGPDAKLPPETTPLSTVLTDSMMVLSALIALEEKVQGDLGRLDPNAPPPQTLGDFIRLGALLAPAPSAPSADASPPDMPSHIPPEPDINA